MAKKRKADQSGFGEESSSWRSRIAQSTNRRATTGAARWRRWKQVLKIGGAFVLACAVIAGAIVALNFLRSEKADELLGTGSQPLKRVYFASNGVLDQGWIENTINIPAGTPLMSINIHEVQERLSRVGQIRSVVVERIFPDGLYIRVDEREPLLRMVLRDEAGARRVFLVSRRGHVYRGQNYPTQMLRELPYVAGVNLRTDSAGAYLPVEGIGALSEFVDLARLLLPDLAANWRYLDLSRYEGGPRSVGSEIRVHTRGGALIIFASGDFQTQFARLNEIITRRLNAEQRARVELIDLSLPDPVVRLADRPGRSGL